MNVLQQLYQLQLLDSEWDEKSFRLKETNNNLGETDELIRARADIVETEGTLKELGSQMRTWEMDISTVNAKLKQNQDRLYSGRVKSPKELSNLHEEAAALRRRIAELEDGQLELMIEIEEAEAELAERQARSHQIEANWHKDQANLLAEKEEMEFDLAELEEKRGIIRPRIRGMELAEYDSLRARLGGIGVALLKRGNCQICGVNVPTGMALSVERGEGMHYCPVCNRLLYGG